MEQPLPNPFSPPSAESVSSGFDVRRQELSPHVRSYVDTLYVQIRQIFDKYRVANIEDLRDGVKDKKIKMERKDVERLKDLTRWLRDILKERKVPDEILEMQGEFILDHIEHWDKWPPAYALDGHNMVGNKYVDVIQGEMYRSGRPMSDLELDGQDLDDIGLDDERKRSVMKAMKEAYGQWTETRRKAKIFDVSAEIERKKKEDPTHPDYLTPKEVFEAMDDAGFRPATLIELMAYTKTVWEPVIDEDARQGLSDAEKRKPSHYPVMYAYGSCYVDSDDRPRIPVLYYNSNGKRTLQAVLFNTNSFPKDYLLMIQK